MYHELFLLIWSRGPWIQSDQDRLDRFSDQITLCSVGDFISYGMYKRSDKDHLENTRHIDTSH